jgi:MerR family copper efflux transcriptional regulator
MSVVIAVLGLDGPMLAMVVVRSRRMHHGGTLYLQVDFNVKRYHLHMRIGEVAKRSGLSATTVRYYEDIGLVPQPSRAPNGYRDYLPEAVERLRFIRDAQDSGLTLTEIASILELRGQGESTCHHVIELMEHHLEEVDRRIETLRASRELYAALISRAKVLDPAECTDSDRCQTISTGPDHVPARTETLPGVWRDDTHSHRPSGTT